MYFTKLANKLIYAFSLIVFLILFLVITISYVRTTGIIKENYIVNSKRDMKHVSEGLDNFVDSVDSFSLDLRQDERFMNILKSEGDGFETRIYIENQLKAFFYTHKDMAALSFYVASHKNNYSISQYTTSMTIKYDDTTEKQAWYQEVRQPPSFSAIRSPLYADTTENLSVPQETFFTFHRMFVNVYNKNTPLGAITITLNGNKRSDLIKDILHSSEERFAIFDKNNIPYYVSDSAFFLKDSQRFLSQIDTDSCDGDFIWKYEKDRFQVMYYISEKGGWKLVKFIPIHELNASAETTRALSLMLGVISLILFLPLVVVASNAITKPLNLLSRKMEMMGTANFDVHIVVKGTDEIAHLSRKFNVMVTRIKELIDEEYKAKLSEKNAHMRALEAQVNPHFLYNSLQAISTKALIHGKADIQEMVDALALTLRYSIKGANVVKAEQEIEHVRRYLVLQKARFGERISVTFQLDEDILAVTLPKLSIQTLVENCVKHSLEQMLEPISIVIFGYVEEHHVVIRVCDNGLGISSEKLLQIEQRMLIEEWVDDENESIGLINLQRRLKLIKGPEARLEIRSPYLDGNNGNPTKGTEVKMVLPF